PEHNVTLRRFKHVCGDFLRLGLDLVESLDDRRHSDRGRTRAISSHTELHFVGVAVDDRNVFEWNAEAFRNKLCEGRLVALPVRMCAGQHFHAASWVDSHLRTLP